MPMLTLNGRPIKAGGLLRRPPVLPTVVQDQRIGAGINSLFNYSAGTGSTGFTNAGVWAARIADAATSQSVQMRSMIGLWPSWNFNPPDFDDSIAGVPVPGSPYADWAGFNAVNYSAFIFGPDNYNGPTGLDPSTAGPVASTTDRFYPDEIAGFIDQIEQNGTGSYRYYIYEGLKDAGGIIDDPSTATAQDFADFRAATTDPTDYQGWFDALLTQVRADARVTAVANNVSLIPASRVIVSVMENTAASALTAADWFLDSAPHGTEVLYLLSGMITYSTIFGQVAPEPDFAGATLPSVFTSNYAAIAAHVASEVGA